MELSIVIPVFNEEENIEPLIHEIDAEPLRGITERTRLVAGRRR